MSSDASRAPHGRPRPLRRAQLEELSAFCAAVELGGVGRAAQRLHISQPALSRRLQALEAVAGQPLLERSPRGVRVTAAGERVYAHARRLLAVMREVDDVLEDLHGRGATVHLAISHTAAEFLMPRALVLMRRRTSAPVEVLIANSRVVKRMVAAGEADVGVAACFLQEELDGHVSLPLIEDEIAIAVPLAHPWTRRASITSAELLSSPVVLRDPEAHSRQVIDAALAAAGLAPLQAACEVGSTQAAKDEAHELGLPTAMSRLALSAADRLEIVAVEGLRFTRAFCLLHSPATRSAASAHLIESFQQAAAHAQASRAASARHETV
jgi:LysR family transcriptional regulator, transcriptional activator of the cysJI operon